MNTSLRWIHLLAALAAFDLANADDKLVTVDATASTVTIEQRGTLRVIRTKPFTDVLINGAKGDLNQLRPGMMLNITLSDPQTASRITAKGVAIAPPADPKKPVPFYNRPPPPKSIHIRLRVDGTDRLRYADGKFWIEHGSNKKPEEITINGVEWKPTWVGDITEPFTAFDPKPVPMGNSRIIFKQLAGRAKAELEKPPAGNFEKIATIEVKDPPGDFDTYEFTLSWN
jgi:hypothetical protein